MIVLPAHVIVISLAAVNIHTVLGVMTTYVVLVLNKGKPLMVQVTGDVFRCSVIPVQQTP